MALPASSISATAAACKAAADRIGAASAQWRPDPGEPTITSIYGSSGREDTISIFITGDGQRAEGDGTLFEVQVTVRVSGSADVADALASAMLIVDGDGSGTFGLHGHRPSSPVGLMTVGVFECVSESSPRPVGDRVIAGQLVYTVLVQRSV